LSAIVDGTTAADDIKQPAHIMYKVERNCARKVTATHGLVKTRSAKPAVDAVLWGARKCARRATSQTRKFQRLVLGNVRR